MTITRPEPKLLFVQVSSRLVLRIALIGGRAFAGWFFDGEAVREPEFAPEA